MISPDECRNDSTANAYEVFWAAVETQAAISRPTESADFPLFDAYAEFLADV